MNKSKNLKPMTSNDLQKAVELVQKAEQLETEKCSAEIQMVLAKYKRTMIPQFILRGTQTIPQVLIVPITQNTPPPVRMRSTQEEFEQE